jgi:hypothetical protein
LVIAAIYARKFTDRAASSGGLLLHNGFALLCALGMYWLLVP